MNSDEAAKYIELHRDYFAQDNINEIKMALIKCGKDVSAINRIKLSSPNKGLLISVLLGWLGIDRFYAKSYIAGIIKLLTLGCYGIWWIIDWFMIKKCIRYNNYITLMVNLGIRPAKCSSANIFARGLVDGMRSKQGRQITQELKKSTKNLHNTFDINNGR